MLLIIYGIIEYIRHQKLISSISIRIHVNGSRGKSSVTRLIGAGLRAGGINTITKVTGTYPRLILNNGEEANIRRKAGANILEQLKIVEYCANQNAEALVIECMALQPEFQHITEHKMIHSTIGVITNIRLDHLDVMGPTAKDVAKSLSATIPYNKHLFTSENKNFSFLEKISKKRNTTIFKAESSTVSSKDMQGFKYIEHIENVSLALDVCRFLGVQREIAISGMQTTTPDEGALIKNTILENNKRINFYNGFAANDPESSFMIWKLITNTLDDDELKIILLSTRQDRIDRTKQLLKLLTEKLHFDFVVLIGESINMVNKIALKSGIPEGKIICKKSKNPENICTALINLANNKTTIVGMGNMKGMGAKISKHFIKKQINNK